MLIKEPIINIFSKYNESNKKTNNKRVAILEAVLLPILIPLLIWALGRQDVFFLESAFPWLILIPTLTASKYGTWYSLLSLTVLSLLCLVYVFLFQPLLLSAAVQIIAGSLLLVVLVGEMTQRWRQRENHHAEQLKICRQTTHQSEQALQILHISYSQLEEELVTTTQSLTGSLRLLEIKLEHLSDKKERLQLAIRKLREILQDCAWIEAAAFYHVNSEGNVTQKPLKSIGVIDPTLHKDPLITEVIKSRQAVRLNKEPSENSKIKHSNLQACIPLIDNNDHLWGVMAVSRITPSSFIQQNLNLLSLLCSYVANLLSNAQQPIPNAKLLFEEVHTSLNVVLNTVKSLTLITVDIKDSAQEQDYQQFFTSKVRGANRIWSIQRNKGATLIVLLPLFNADNAAQWQHNLENNFAKQFGSNFSEAEIRLTPRHFRKEGLHHSLENYLKGINDFDYAHLIR